MTREEAIEKLKGFDLIGSNEDIEFQEALDMAIDALERTRLIQVSEKLPEKEEEVLICINDIDGIQYDVAHLIDTKHAAYDGDYYWIGKHVYGKQNVSVWMPLPQPYKAESEVEVELKKVPIPQPKVGHWIDTGSGQECSECGKQCGYDNFGYFCPYCGAEMEG